MHIPVESTNNFKPIEENIEDVRNIEQSIIDTEFNNYYTIDNMNIQSIIDIITKNNKYSVLIDSGAFFRDNIMFIINILYDKLIKTGLFECIVFIDNNDNKKIAYKNSDTLDIIDYSLKTNIDKINNLQKDFIFLIKNI